MRNRKWGERGWLATFTRLLGLVWCNGTVPMPGDVVRVDFAAFEMEE